MRASHGPATPENSAAFVEKSLKTVCFDSFIFTDHDVEIHKLQRAWKESLCKSDRISSAWQKKRNSGKPLTDHCPAWLEIVRAPDSKDVRDGKFVEKPEVVAVVQEMFELASQGLTTRNIFKRLNGRLEGRSLNWVARTLRNRAVLGEYEFKDNESVLLFPTVVTQAKFDGARLVIEKRIRNDKKVKAQGGRYSQERVDNLFSALVFDVTEGEPRPMHYQRCTRGGKVSAQYLRSQELGDGRKPHSIQYVRFERAMLSFIETADWEKNRGCNRVRWV